MQEISSGVFFESHYEGVNVLAILTDEGVICVDVPSYPRDARDWVSKVGRLHGRGVRYLILSDYHGDRILNCRWLTVPIICSQPTADRLGAYDKRYPQSLLESLSQRNPPLGRELASGPVDQAAVSFTGKMTFHLGRRTINLEHRPGPNAGSIWLSWPDADIVVTGDSVVSASHPPLGEALLDQWLESLKALLSREYATSLIVPGRGELCGPETVLQMIDYLESVEVMVSQHIAEGRSRQELSRQIPEIAALFASVDATEWTEREIGLGLRRVYDQMLAASSVSVGES